MATEMVKTWWRRLFAGQDVLEGIQDFVEETRTVEQVCWCSSKTCEQCAVFMRDGASRYSQDDDYEWRMQLAQKKNMRLGAAGPDPVRPDDQAAVGEDMRGDDTQHSAQAIASPVNDLESRRRLGLDATLLSLQVAREVLRSLDNEGGPSPSDEPHGTSNLDDAYPSYESLAAFFSFANSRSNSRCPSSKPSCSDLAALQQVGHEPEGGKTPVPSFVDLVSFNDVSFWRPTNNWYYAQDVACAIASSPCGVNRAGAAPMLEQGCV